MAILLRMQTQFDSIVIGAGAMGSAATYHLAKDGVRVLLLEQFEFGHGLGSSHGESRIFRFAYTHADYARLAMQCRPMWQALERETGTELLRLIGGLDLGHDDVGLQNLAQVRTALQQIGAPFDELTPTQLAQRYPQWRLPEQGHAIYSPDTGFVWADRALQTMRQQAAAHGAVLQDREAVTKIVPHADGVEVFTNKGQYQCRRLVIAAGAWVNEVLRGAGLQLPIKIECEQLHYFAPRAAQQFGADKFTVWIHYGREIGYGFPALGADGYPYGVKCGFHHDHRYIQANDLDRTPDPAVIERIRQYLETYLPEAAGELLSSMRCLYTNTPSEDFVVDTLPGFPHIALASPCSGHGFKFCIGIGRALADLVQIGNTALQIEHIRLSRLPISN